MAKDLGDFFLKSGESTLLVGIFGLAITTFISSSSSVRNTLKRIITMLDLNTLFGVVVSAFLFVFLFVIGIVFFAAIVSVLLKQLGYGITWLSKHKLGDPIAKSGIEILELPSENSNIQRDFIVKVINKENLTAYNVSLSYEINPLYSNNEKGVMGVLNGYWIKKTDNSNKEINQYGNEVDFEYHVDIQGEKERSLFFVKVDKISKKFFMRSSGIDVQEFSAGRYMLNILLFGKMEKRKLVAKQSGEIIFHNDGTIVFNLKKVKQKRDWTSLVEEPLWKFE
jgi:hypothetical protein